MLSLFSPGWPHAVFVNLQSSTTDPFGTHPALRASGQRRKCFGAALLGGSSYTMYGDDASLAKSLASKVTMAQLEANLKQQGDLPRSMKLNPPGAPPPSL